MSREQLRAAGDAEISRWEKAIADELLRLFDRQEAVVLVRLQGTKARKHTRHWYPLSETPRPLEVKAIIDPARWIKAAGEALAPVVTRLFEAVYRRVAAQLDAAGDPAPPAGELEQSIADRLARIGEGVEGALGEVERYIEAEEDAGTAMKDIAEGVRQIYNARKPSWATRIATLSSVGSINQAALLAASAKGSSAKQWLSQRDNVVRDTHVKADGQVRLLDEKFRLGGFDGHPRAMLLFPGDPSPLVPIGEVINCRCLLLFSPPRKDTKALPSAGREACTKCGEVLVFGVDGDWWSMPDGSIGCDEGGSHEVAEVKAGPRRVRTAAGAAAYGQPIGSIIVADVVGTIGSSVVEDASDDPDVRRLVSANAPSFEPDKTSIYALRDSKGRVGAYVAWQKTDGVKPAGTIVAVSVHPALRGQRIGDQLVAMAAADDPRLVVTTRPTPPQAPARAPAAAPAAPRAKPGRRPLDSRGLPVITDRRQATDGDGGPTGDYAADAARIDRLQRAYLKDGADTVALFSRGGRFNTERHKQQEAIVDGFLNAPGVKRDRKLLVMGGLPGAGKTTTIRSAAGQAAVGVDLDEYVVVNSDDVKERMIAAGMVPDYPGLTPEESATLIQAEAYGIACTVMRRAGANGSNFVYDATLRTESTLSTATAVLRGSGWSSTLVFVDVPLPVAKQRARDRYASGDRYVPEAFIDRMAPRSAGSTSLPAEVFMKINGQVDAWHFVDNAGTDPVVLQSGKGRRRGRRP